MSLSAAEITQVLREITPVVTGGWIQKIFQPTPRVLVLEVRAPGRTISLLLSVDVETARLHLLSQKLSNPPVPPSFCQYLRAHIQGASIDGLEQLGGDRIVRIRLTAREGPCSLLGELTGRRGTLFLLDAEDRVLAALDKEPGEVGEPYAPPARRPRPDAAGDTEPESISAAFTSDGVHPFPLSEALEARYLEREAELARTRLRQARLVVVRKSLKKTARRVAALQADLEKSAKYKEYARYGELLKASLGRMKKGQERVTLVDYFDPTLPELVIPLDPAKSPQGNMDDYFKKHRKHLAAERQIRPRLEAAERELDALRKELAALQAGIWEPPAAPPPPAGKRQRDQPSPSRPTTRPGPYRRFTSADGLPIYVGRNARENEELTFKFAHSDDLWLHARGTPGSHVVVRLKKGSDPPPETIRDAATLALLYSDLKKSGKGEVIYTRRKWVKKMKGQPAGTVAVTQDKSVFVALDKTRLEALKERSGRSGGW